MYIDSNDTHTHTHTHTLRHEHFHVCVEQSDTHLKH